MFFWLPLIRRASHARNDSGSRGPRAIVTNLSPVEREPHCPTPELRKSKKCRRSCRNGTDGFTFNSSKSRTTKNRMKNNNRFFDLKRERNARDKRIAIKRGKSQEKQSRKATATRALQQLWRLLQPQPPSQQGKEGPCVAALKFIWQK